MKKTILVFLAGVVAGGVATYFGLRAGRQGLVGGGKIAPQAPPVCYSCFWQGYSPKLRADVIDFYRQYKNPDPLVMADVGYILWRTSDNANCDVRQEYASVAENDPDLNRRLMARAILGFSGPECGWDGSRDLRAAGQLAGKIGLSSEAGWLSLLGRNKLQPRFEDVSIASELEVPPGAKSMVLGETTLEIPPGARIGTQVDRVARDWISYQMRWDLTAKPLEPSSVLDYHEGALVRRIASFEPVSIYPMAGAFALLRAGHWYAPDETGSFRFEVLPDKLQYPTSHAAGSYAWIEDTHGVSALVPQALERHMQVVIGCGDSEGKVKASFYLAQKGVNVIYPGDRYADLLLGYKGRGVLLGTAPVKKAGDKVVVGGQPVRFSLAEPIVVEDTRQVYPIQYYDAGARYFRRLSQWVRLNVEYVSVDAPDQIARVLDRAAQLNSSAVGVRVYSQAEYEALSKWLAGSPARRAILFHSGLYPYAQPLFEQFPRQVTFGDLHPHFE